MTDLHQPRRSLCGVRYARNIRVSFTITLYKPAKVDFHPANPYLHPHHETSPEQRLSSSPLAIKAGTTQASSGFVRIFHTRSFLRWLTTHTDYLIRQVVSLTRGGVKYRILWALRKSLKRTQLRMVHVISALSFVSRMRLRDRGGSNAIPLSCWLAVTLYNFFHKAAFFGPVGVQCHSLAWFRTNCQLCRPPKDRQI